MQFCKTVAESFACQSMSVMAFALVVVAMLLISGSQVQTAREGRGITSHRRQRPAALQTASGLQQAEMLVLASQVGLQRHYNPKFSSFSCIGTPWGHEVHVIHGYKTERHKFHPFRRNCRFDNICLNHTSLQYVFFHPEGAEDATDRLPIFYDLSGQPHYSFPEGFVNIGNSEIAPYIFWQPNTVHASIPDDALFHQSPVHMLIAPNVMMGNLGHALFDFLFLAFNSMQLFNVYHEDFQLVFGDKIQDYDNGISPEAHAANVDKFINASDPERNLLLTVSNNRALTREELATKLPGELSCFKTLITGTFLLEARNSRVSARAFRSAVVTHLKVTEQPPSDHPVMTIITKKGRRIIENNADIVDMLKSSFPIAEVVVIDGDELAEMSFADQVRAMARTNIFFSPGGGTAAIVIFLPPGATAIIVNHWEVERKSSAQMDASNFNNMDYLDFVYFPVTPEDYEGTSDRPGCEWDAHLNRGGTLKQCNVRIKDMSRVENVFRMAIKRWVTMFGKYPGSDEDAFGEQ